MTVNAVADERTLREIYLASFETAVKEAKPWSVMSAYNRVNGEFCSENHHLLREILREEWGYEGVVISDWGAVNNQAKGIEEGFDLRILWRGRHVLNCFRFPQSGGCIVTFRQWPRFSGAIAPYGALSLQTNAP